MVIVDDLIATGGTVEATAKLVEELGGQVWAQNCVPADGTSQGLKAENVWQSMMWHQ